MLKLRNLTAGLGLAVAFAGSAHAADKAILATWLEPNHPISVYSTIAWSEAIKKASNGELDFDVMMGGALMPPAATMQGTADGLAQIGLHTATYTPSDLPVSNALADMGFTNPDSFVLAFAFTDFMMNDKAGYDDWRGNGVIYGGGFASPPYYFICREELRTLADFQGKRVRYPGGGWARFGEALGTVGVAIASSEMYTAMERGSIDCTLSDATHLTGGATLLEVTKGVTMLPTSPFYSAAVWIYNPDYWKGLTDAQRRIFLDETAAAQVRMEMGYLEDEKKALDAARARGVKIVEPDETLTAAYDNWVAEGVGDMAGVVKERHGIEDPEALFASFKVYIDKWAGLLGSVDRTDEAALIALVKANLYDRIDEKTYGME